MTVSTASLNINVKTDGVAKADNELEGLTSAGKKTEKQVESLQREIVSLNKRLTSTSKVSKLSTMAVNDASKGFKVNSFQVQNAAFQMQDLVTQLEMGTSASRALSQQLPQLLGGFGAVGAVVGLVSGLAFALGGPLVNSLFDGVDAVESLEDSLEGLEGVVVDTENGVSLLAQELSDLAKRSRVSALTQIQLKVIDLEDSLSDVRSELGELGDDLVSSFFSTISGFDEAIGAVELYGMNWISLSKTLDLSEAQAKDLALVFKSFGNGLKDEKGISVLRQEFEAFFITLEKPDEKLVEFATGLSKLDEKSIAATEKLEFLKNAFTNLDEVLSNSSVESEKLAELDRVLLREGEIAERRREREANSLLRDEERLAEHFRKMDEIKEKESQKEKLRLEEQDADLREQLAKRNEDTIKGYQDLAGAMASSSSGAVEAIGNIAGEASTAYRVAFAAAKGFAVAQASLNFGLALTQAMALPADTSLPQKLASYVTVLGTVAPLLSSISSVKLGGGRLQGGAVDSGTARMVGERGPELFIPDTAGSVVNNNKMRNGGGGGGETNITIVNQTTGRIDQVERQQLSESDVVLIIKEVVPREIANPNSKTSKQLNSSTSTSRRLV